MQEAGCLGETIVKIDLVMLYFFRCDFCAITELCSFMNFLGGMLDENILFTLPGRLCNMQLRDGVVFVSYRNSISASQPSALTPTMSPQIPLVSVTGRLTTANNTEIQGDPAIVPLVDDGFHSDEKHPKDPEDMLEDLRHFISSMGGRLEKGWEVIRKRRPSNPHVFEKIFISPDKQKFRSRLAVARFLGLSVFQRESKTDVQPAAQRVCSRYA